MTTNRPKGVNTRGRTRAKGATMRRKAKRMGRVGKRVIRKIRLEKETKKLGSQKKEAKIKTRLLQMVRDQTTKRVQQAKTALIRRVVKRVRPHLRRKKGVVRE